MDMFEPGSDCLKLAALATLTPSLALMEYTAITEKKKKKKKKTDETTTDIDIGATHDERPKKKAKKASSLRQSQSAMLSKKSPTEPAFPTCHLSGSKTLELHQELPPKASFERTSLDEKPAWRCGMKHAMGHYYNAGDRKSCRGCNTNVTDSSNNPVLMDFYLPRRCFFYQPAPTVHWKPNKPSSKPRKCRNVCHNGITKDAYWEAINHGATEEEARQKGVKAVVNFLEKPNPVPKAPTLEPKPEPKPKPDLGPHYSGSASMEHGQEISNGSYWTEQSRQEEPAWRCDVNHALGRYYLAGNKKSCSGCGSHRFGPGKHEVMDFYLPPGVVVRQEAPGLSIWKPRKPYHISKPGENKGRPVVTHNQMCSEAYFDLVARGHKEQEALRLAVEQVDAGLLDKEEDKVKAAQNYVEPSIAIQTYTALNCRARVASAHPKQATTSVSDTSRPSLHGGYTVSLVPKKRSVHDEEEGAMHQTDICQSPRVTSSPCMSRNRFELSSSSSSSDQESSGSDTE